MLKALAIVSVFETSRPFGDFSAVAVLDDGAGVSYGFSQFTHRSGSLLQVVNAYLELGGMAARDAIEKRLPLLAKNTPAAIAVLSRDAPFQNALLVAGASPEMRAAQMRVAFERYLGPAVRECRRLGFASPLSLAVVYDSLTHGSWEKVRDRVGPSAASGGRIGERPWLTEYVHRRDAWLAAIPRLAPTRYRTRFFINQIAVSNWDLALPVRVQGVRLTDDIIGRFIPAGLSAPQLETGAVATAPNTNSAVEPARSTTNVPPDIRPAPTQTRTETGPPSQAQPPDLSPPVGAAPTTPSAAPTTPSADHPGRSGHPSSNQEGSQNSTPPRAGGELMIDQVAARYDQAERVVNAVLTRKDGAKSLWTTIAGTIWQTVWAVFGFVAGIPRQVWLVVAVIAAALMLVYLYRQIALGKIRESSANSANGSP